MATTVVEKDLEEEVGVCDEGTVSSAEEGSGASSAGRRSTLMLLTKHDTAIHSARSHFSTAFEQCDLSGSLKKADAMFSALMDPNNPDTKETLRSLFLGPMEIITKSVLEKVVTTVAEVDVSDPERAAATLELVPMILAVIPQIREGCLDNVYENMRRQVDTFSSSVDVYNDKMRETYEQTLKLFEARVESEIKIRQQVLEQKRTEHAAYLEGMSAEADVRATCLRTQADATSYASEKALARQAAKDQKEHEREMKAMERAALKAEKDIEIQRKKNEIENKRLEAELVREKSKDSAAHEKTMKDLEARAARGKIEQEVRDGIVREYQIELQRYNKEFELASAAMRSAIDRPGSSCRITHDPPKIEWGPPPRVVPGTVSYTYSKW